MTHNLSRPSKFDIYRYQLLPFQDVVQVSLFGADPIDTEELKANKNEIFASIFDERLKIRYSRNEITHKIVAMADPYIVLQIAVRKNIRFNPKPFEPKGDDNWQDLFVIINNDPEVQKIAIQRKAQAFQHTSTVQSILQKSFGKILASHNLSIYIEPTYNEGLFWDLVEKHRGKIYKLGFEIISPNIGNLRKPLKLNIAEIKANSNAHKTKIEFEAPENSSLEIKKEDELISQINEYSAEGGGDSYMKIRGFKGTISTGKTTRTVEIDTMEIRGQSPESILDKIKDTLR